MKNEILGFLSQKTKTWWISLLVGLLFLGVGIWMLFVPQATMLAATLTFITIFFVSGILEIIFALMNRRYYYGWGWTLVGGIIDIIFGVLLVFMKENAAFALVIFVGLWILFRSVMMIGTSIQLQKFGIRGWGWFILLAILGILMATLSFIAPVFGMGMIVAFIAAAFIFYGIFRIGYASRLCSINKKLDELKIK